VNRGRRAALAAGARVGAVLAVTKAGWLPGVALATEVTGDAAAPVALAFERRSGKLLRASGHAAASSSDGGRHWSVLPGLQAVRPAAIAVGIAGRLYVPGPAAGILHSDDGGRHWFAAVRGLPRQPVRALAAHADRPDTVYANVERHGIYRSEDGGRQWRLMDAGPRDGIARLIHTNMPGSMKSGWLLAAGPHGVQRAMDCFCGWRKAGSLAGPVRDVGFDPSLPSRVFAATASQVWTSEDGGETWTVDATAPTGVVALVAAPDSVLYGARADGQVVRRAAGATSWQAADA
jgi:photosystem II stability/assembly factor-like uncharacterized protein